MYLYVKTPYGRFADTREIDSDSLSQYMTADISTAKADSVMIEEYEEFFGEVLTQAEHVIHISLGSRAGVSYQKAVDAARGFEHVRIIDSGQISGGQGIIAIYAARLAMEGKSANEICGEINKVIGLVRTQMIFPGADIFYQNGRTTALAAKLCRVFGLHPMVTMRQKNAVLTGVIGGELENAWKTWIHFRLSDKRRINKEVLFITHVGCSVKQLEWIKAEALKCIPFEKVVIQKASLTNACNCGLGSIGISYLLNRQSGTHIML